MFIGALVYFFAEIVVGIFILGAFRLIKIVGILALRVLTLDGRPFSELKEKYAESAKPYWVGFVLILGLVFFVAEIT